MHVISRRALVDFWTLHPRTKSPLGAWFSVVEDAEFRRLADVRQTFNSADRVGNFVIFNVGDGFRIVTAIHFNRGRVYVRQVFTPVQYERWSASVRTFR
jgi:mRNA interferase HigB